MSSVARRRLGLTGAVAHGLIGRTVFLLFSDVHSLDPASFGRQR
jgi:hypothetical protein